MIVVVSMTSRSGSWAHATPSIDQQKQVGDVRRTIMVDVMPTNPHCGETETDTDGDGSLFSGNSAITAGGAIVCDGGSSVILSGTSLCDNTIGSGAVNPILGPWTDSGDNCLVDHCTDADENGFPDDCQTPCAADLNGNDTVDIDDLLLVLGAWGPCAGACPADLNADEAVTIDDLLLLLDMWGPCAE